MMGYFSNGTEGLAYQEVFCAHCAHCGPPDGPGCPVWLLHLVHNGERPMKGILDMFIPNINGAGNDKCQMYINLPDTDNLTGDMFSGGDDEQ
jgi:hypothetical protein